jgi:hypothetical protein
MHCWPIDDKQDPAMANMKDDGAGVRVVILNLYVLWLGYGPEFIGMLSAVGGSLNMVNGLPFMMGAGLAFSGVSFVGGYIIVALGYPVLFWLGTGLVTTGAPAFWSYFRVPRGELASRPCPEIR